MNRHPLILLNCLMMAAPLFAEKHLFCYKYRLFDQLTYQTEGRDSLIYECRERDQTRIRHFYREETFRVDRMPETAPYHFLVFTDTVWQRMDRALSLTADEREMLGPLPLRSDIRAVMTVNGRSVHSDSLYYFSVFSLPLPEFPLGQFDEWEFQMRQNDNNRPSYVGDTFITGKGQFYKIHKEGDMELAIFLMHVTMISTGTVYPGNAMMTFQREHETTGTVLVYFEQNSGRIMKAVADLNVSERRFRNQSSVRFHGNSKTRTRLVNRISMASRSFR